MRPNLKAIRQRVSSGLDYARGLKAGIALLRDPNRLDQVFVLDGAIPEEPVLLARFVAAARSHDAGRAAFEERPRVKVDVERLRALGEGTFGRAVADFFDRNGLHPQSIPSLDAGDDASYARAHLYETHDVWHVATGFGTDVAGELGLQAFYAAQLPGRLPPLLLAGGLLQSVFWAPDDFRSRLAAMARGYQLGTQAQPLFGVRWGELWEQPFEHVKAQLGTD